MDKWWSKRDSTSSLAYTFWSDLATWAHFGRHEWVAARILLGSFKKASIFKEWLWYCWSMGVSWYISGIFMYYITYLPAIFREPETIIELIVQISQPPGMSLEDLRVTESDVESQGAVAFGELREISWEMCLTSFEFAPIVHWKLVSPQKRSFLQMNVRKHQCWMESCDSLKSDRYIWIWLNMKNSNLVFSLKFSCSNLTCFEWLILHYLNLWAELDL